MPFFSFLQEHFSPLYQDVIRIPPDRVLDPRSGLDTLVPSKTYFFIHLCEMFLHNRQQFWQSFTPMAIAFCEFAYGSGRASVPIYIGKNLIEALDMPAQGNHIEYLNTRVVGPVPYLGQEVSLFLGLFGLPAQNVAKGAFDFAEGLLKVFKISPLGDYLKIAKTVEKGISGILGLNQARMQLGNWTEFTSLDQDYFQFRPGYLAYVNGSLDQQEKDSLWVREGRLCKGNDRDTLDPFADRDYCLVRITGVSKREDYPALGFDDQFTRVARQISNNKKEVAEYFLYDLFDSIRSCPDLIPDHRKDLFKVYLINYENSWEMAAIINQAGTVSAPAVRGALSQEKPSDVLERMAFVASEKNMSLKTKIALKKLARHMDEIIGHPKRPEDLTSEEINRQLDVMAGLDLGQGASMDEMLKVVRMVYESSD